MGTSRTAKELHRKIDTAARKIEAANVAAVSAGALEMKRVTLAKMAAATGGDLVLSGTTRSTGNKRSTRTTGRKVGVRYKVERRSRGPQAYIRATGPAELIENDVKKHIVVSRHAKGAGYTRVNAKGKTVAGRTTRQSRQASVAFGLGAGGGGRRAVLHWGGNYARFTTASSKGRHPFEHGIKASAPAARRIVVQANRKALISGFL